MANVTKEFANKVWFTEIVDRTNLVEKCDVFVDIGVGIKDSEAWIVSAAGFDNNRILGFEPHEKRYEQLKNIYPGSLFNEAVSAQDCILVGNSGDDFIAATMSNSDKNLDSDKYVTGAIKSTSVDSILATINAQCACVWADVEGSEYDIVLGACRSLMFSKIGIMFLELRNHPSTYYIVNFLSKFGYFPVGASGLASFSKEPGKGGYIQRLWLQPDEHADVAFMKMQEIDLDSFYFDISEKKPSNIVKDII